MRCKLVQLYRQLGHLRSMVVLAKGLHFDKRRKQRNLGLCATRITILVLIELEFLKQISSPGTPLPNLNRRSISKFLASFQRIQRIFALCDLCSEYRRCNFPLFHVWSNSFCVENLLAPHSHRRVTDEICKSTISAKFTDIKIFPANFLVGVFSSIVSTNELD